MRVSPRLGDVLGARCQYCIGCIGECSYSTEEGGNQKKGHNEVGKRGSPTPKAVETGAECPM